MTAKQYENAMRGIHAFADRVERNENLAAKYNALRSHAAEMTRALERVANLNPNAGEIGDGMLKTIVEEARKALRKP